jgi:HK97 gp10 family phage protein
MKPWTLKLTGMEDLAKRLRALPEAVTKQVLREALKKAAEPMRAKMAVLAPVGPEAPHLASSMRISPGKAEETTGVAVLVGPSRDFFYGRFLEYGTKHMSARPFMRPAFDSEAQTALDTLGRELWYAISRGASPGGTGTL